MTLASPVSPGIFPFTTLCYRQAEHARIWPGRPQKVRENPSARALGDVDRSSQLDYPTQLLKCSEPERMLNVLMIVIDGARWDMMDPRWMPNIYEFAEANLIFENHYSNGNATKPGMFTLLYSLPASYWDAFTAAKKPPVMISRMQQLGYQTRVLGSAILVSPAFDQNAFASIPDLRLETPGEQTWDRDIRITEDWLSFTRSELDPELIKNNYKSTRHFVDNQVDKVLDDLQARGLLDSTIVVITGDHGQEFNEYGMNYWGHGSNFGEYQLRVPMMVHWPARAAGRIGYRTENFDIAPTLMSEALACEDTPTDAYATGNSMFRPSDHSWSIAHSYMDSALLLNDLKLITYTSGSVEALNDKMETAPEYSRSPTITAEVLRELSRFYE